MGPGRIRYQASNFTELAYAGMPIAAPVGLEDHHRAIVPQG